MLNDRFLKWMIDEIKHLHGVENKTDYAPMGNSIFIEKIKGKRIVNPKNFTWTKPTITKITKKDEIPCP